jgi:hypothetical protein
MRRYGGGSFAPQGVFIPVFNYHRFWAENDIATALDTFAFLFLFPSVQPPSGFQQHWPPGDTPEAM